MRHAVFYCRIADPSLLTTLEFYSHDIRLLEAIADRVTVCTSFAELRRAEPGLLFAWWHPTALPAIAWWRLHRRQVIATGAVDLTNPTETGWRHRLKRPLTWLSARLATLNIAISDFERNDLRRLVPRHPVETLHPGVDCAFFAPGQLTDEPTVTTVAQVNPASIHRKGLDRVIEAFGAARADVPTARLRIIGPISAEGQAWIDSQIAAGKTAGVEFCGFVDRDIKRSILASSWTYLQPSRYEGFGLAVAEALASGIVPIVTRVGSLPEVVGDIGAIVDEGDTAALRDRLVAALSSPPDDARRARAAAAASRFDTRTRLDRFRSIFPSDT
jgi:glycosyltransferase involved in cell wall biosynthesis